MDENEWLAGRPRKRPIPPLKERDGVTIMTWHVRTAHPVDGRQLIGLAGELSNDSISLGVDYLDNETVTVSVKSSLEAPYEALWDFSIRSLLIMDQRLGELVAIEGKDRDEWRYQFVVAEHCGTFNDDKTSLMIAAERGDLNQLIALLATEVTDIDKRTPFGHSALSYAASNGHADAVIVLLNSGARPLTGREITTLQASLLGGIEVLKLLLIKEVDVNGRNRYGETVLMTATALGNVEIIKELLIHGADPNLKDNASRNAFDRAHENQRREVLEALQRFTPSQ